MGELKRKVNQIRDAWTAGDQIGALRIAAHHPDFYRQLGKKPQEVVIAALEILAKRFELP